MSERWLVELRLNVLLGQMELLAPVYVVVPYAIVLNEVDSLQDMVLHAAAFVF